MLRIRDLPQDLNELKALWQGLEARAEHSFFISWPWVDTWLKCLREERVQPKLLTVDHGERTVAAALLTWCKPRRHVLWAPRTWVLNATGNEALDTIFVEYNGLLAEQGYETSSWRQWIEHLNQNASSWDEVRLDGIPPSVLSMWRREGVALRDETPRTGRFVDLDAVRASGKPFVENLSKNTLRKVRQSRTAFEKHGPITVSLARDDAEARRFFDEMKRLHEARWQSIGGGQGAFTHAMFERFHTSLITDHFLSGSIQLFKVLAGQTTVGILYNFVYRGQVLQYQSGLNYELVVKNESPGLLTHALAIEHNIANQMARYDLLAGDSQYKRSLAENAYELWWGTIQQDRYKFRAEEWLRRGWQRARGRLSGGSAGAANSGAERDVALS